MGQMKFSNNAITTLYAGIGAGATTLNVAPGTGDNFPQVTGGSGDFFIITMEDASGNIEMIRCDHRAAASDTMGNGSYPLQRAYYDATRFPARAWNAGDTVDNRPIAAALSSVGMMGANNLGEITNAATARTNLGLGSMAIEAAATYQTVAGMSAYQTVAGMSSYQTVAGMSAYQTTAGMSAYMPIAGGQFTGAALFKSGLNNKASAATVDLTAIGANTCHITGTTGISAWTMTSGQVVDVVFDGALTLTHHATNNNLPGAANITTAANDRARLWYDGTAVWCVAYQKAGALAPGELPAQNIGGTTSITLSQLSKTLVSATDAAVYTLPDLATVNNGAMVAFVCNAPLATGFTVSPYAGQQIASNVTGIDPVLRQFGSSVLLQASPVNGRWYVIGGSMALGYQLLASAAAASSAAIDFTAHITSGFNEYLITVTNLVPATNASDLWFRVSTDGGSTFKAGASDYGYAQGGGSSGAAAYNNGSGAGAQIAMAFGLSNAGASRPLSGEIRIFGPASSSEKMITWHFGFVDSAGVWRYAMGAGSYNATTVIDAFRLMMSSGNIASGTIALYGLRR